MTAEQETLEAMPASPKELTAHIRSICKEEREADFVSRMETQEKETMAKNMEFLRLFPVSSALPSAV